MHAIIHMAMCASHGPCLVPASLGRMAAADHFGPSLARAVALPHSRPRWIKFQGVKLSVTELHLKQFHCQSFLIKRLCLRKEPLPIWTSLPHPTVASGTPRIKLTASSTVQERLWRCVKLTVSSNV